MDGAENGEHSRKMVFVTVGTTCFDALVKTVDSQQVREELSRKGYTDLLIQMGRGSYMPSKVSILVIQINCIACTNFFAGSGSIFETLRLGKPLIVVVNEDLMDNHQSELAEELAERKHLFYARPQTLHQTIQDMSPESLIPYSPGNPMPVVRLMNKFLGFPTD
ncbi:hypothetical protein BHE74_00003735 [Ensete ventricosum]|nr:hypothetical protein GW17_00035353 [Ensete ventricosum]RWW87441.1 hypothetical protein BHE74_00003735 [Ensete ventricosum]RZR97652.1 hypothetical protein BHM03_00026881 [Ensete ventricosum]